MTPEKRVLVALKVLAAVRSNIENAGNKYSGGMVPNLQSVSDVLTLPDGFLQGQLGTMGAKFLPTPEEEARLLAEWAAERPSL